MGKKLLRWAVILIFFFCPCLDFLQFQGPILMTWFARGLNSAISLLGAHRLGLVSPVHMLFLLVVVSLLPSISVDTCLGATMAMLMIPAFRRRLIDV